MWLPLPELHRELPQLVLDRGVREVAEVIVLRRILRAENFVEEMLHRPGTRLIPVGFGVAHHLVDPGVVLGEERDSVRNPILQCFRDFDPELPRLGGDVGAPRFDRVPHVVFGPLRRRGGHEAQKDERDRGSEEHDDDGEGIEGGKRVDETLHDD